MPRPGRAMVRSGRAWLAVLVTVAVAWAGCVGGDSDAAPAARVELPTGVPALLPIVVSNVMNFTQSVVAPAVGIASDLYEPTMEVSDTGTIYVAGHVVGAATTGTPAYFSNDDGATWEPLPLLASLQTPSPLQGSQPPPGDEGFIVAGENGQAWMADIYAAGFSITGWCDNGASQCYDNRQAFDRAESTLGCKVASLNDRPWAAFANGTLLLVNNPGGGPMQIGVMDVPPAMPVGVATANGPVWNTCASTSGWIPGVPAMRADGLFAVPQMVGAELDQALTVVVGNKEDIFDVETRRVFPVTSVGDGTSNGGRATFDRVGTFFVGARNNTADKDGEPEVGQFVLAVSTDGASSFRNATFVTGTPVRSLYLDGNMGGAGALLSWSQLGEDEARSDWYVAHVSVGPDGAPRLENVTLAVDEGPHSSAHVMGAAAGPDGRAYIVNFASAPPEEYAGSTPISVWIQQDGPSLPVG